MAQTLFDKARAFYGTTENPYDAGYLLPDGYYLDFSDGGGQGRSQDHRNIGWVFGGKAVDLEPHEKMRRFINSGAIRVGQYNAFDRERRGIGFEAHKRPTPEQLATIRRSVRFFRPLDVTVERVSKTGDVVGQHVAEWRPQHEDVEEMIAELWG